MLARLAMLKAGCGLHAGACVIEIDGGEIQVLVVEYGFEAGDFGTEPAGEITVSVNGDADLTLLDDGVNLNGTEGVGAEADMHLGVHLGIHLQISGGTGCHGHKRRCGSGRRGVEHLVSLGKLVCGIGSDLGWGRGGWRSGSGRRSRGIFSGDE